MSMNEENGLPRVSVVTVVRNSVDSIEGTINSVLSQTYKNVEYVVIDGCSDDGTTQIVRKYEGRIGKIVVEPDTGIYDAMNKAVALCTGEWIHFLNSGDLFHDSRVLESVFAGDRKDRSDVLYGSVLIIEGDEVTHRSPKAMSLIKLGIPFCHQSCFVRLAVMKTHLFDTSYRYVADYVLFNTLRAEGFKFKELPLCIARYRNEGFSGSALEKVYAEKQRFLRNKGFVSRALLFLCERRRILRSFLKNRKGCC